MGAFSRQFYAKLAGGCFVIGACMEFFMIKTGFYGVVKDNEAGRWLETEAVRRERQAELRRALLERQRGGKVRLPPSLLRELEESEKQEHEAAANQVAR